MVSCGAFWVVFYVIDSYKYKIAKGRTVADGLYTLQTIQLEASIPPITKALYLPTFPFSHPFLVPLFPFFPSPSPFHSPPAVKGVWRRCKLASGVWGEASADIDFGVFWERKTHLTAIIMDFCILKFVELLIKSPKLSLAHLLPTVDRDVRPCIQCTLFEMCQLTKQHMQSNYF